jgi:hypothetical protein
VEFIDHIQKNGSLIAGERKKGSAGDGGGGAEERGQIGQESHHGKLLCLFVPDLGTLCRRANAATSIDNFLNQ